MNIIELIRGIFQPAVELVDELHTSEEEKLRHKAKTLDTYVKAIEQGIAYITQEFRQKAKIIEAEAKSEHWLTSTWRPITMLSLLSLVMMDSYGWLSNPLSDQAWLLLQIGVGGYVTGRSVEKVAEKIVGALKKKDEV